MALVILAVGAALAGCSSVGGNSTGSRGTDIGTAAANVKQGGTLVVALAGEPDKLDPTLARSLLSRYIFSAMCEKLYDLDANTQIVPQLAKAMPQITDGGKTVTIPLRQGITFADGTPFNAAAVKKSLERDLTLPDSARKSELGPIGQIDAPNQTTVVIHLKSPFTPLTAALADRAGMVMSPKQLDALGENFGNAPVCVGPFKLAKRVPQSEIDLVPDPHYYDRSKVHLDRIVYRIITDANIRAANLQSGDVQVADTLNTESVATLQKTSGLTVLESDSLGYQGITINVGNVKGVGQPPGRIATPIAQKAAVRQALSYAIDRKALVQTVFNGLFDPACSAISPKTAYNSNDAQKCPDADPAKAKSLLASAGVAVPVKLKMLITNTPDGLRLGQALQAQVKPAGFDLTLEPAEFTSLLDREDAGDFQIVQIGWSGRVDPDANLTNFVGTEGSQNDSGYSNPKVDALLTQARTEQSPQARAQLYGQVADILNTDMPLIYLYRQRNLTGVSDKVSGVQVFPDGIIRVAFAGFTK